MNESSPRFEVVVPTKNRPEKLERCLAALSRAREELPLSVLVADSSDDPRHDRVASVCAEHRFVKLLRHDGANVGAARNFCARSALAPALISVDDDVQVHRDALVRLAAAYERAPRPSVVAGSVSWSGVYHRPVVMRRIGYGRPAREDESPSFVITALFAFPRAVALALPWNERVDSSDDLFVGALWRRHGIHLGYEPEARADHDPEHHHYGVDSQAAHIYVNLFDALIANRDLKRALAYEVFGFAAGARVYCRTWAGTRRYLSEWTRGHRDLVRDRRYLRSLVERSLPPDVYADSRAAGLA